MKIQCHVYMAYLTILSSCLGHLSLWYLTWVNFEGENKNGAIDLKSLEAAFQEEGDLQPHLVENLIKEAQPETHREFVSQPFENFKILRSHLFPS